MKYVVTVNGERRQTTLDAAVATIPGEDAAPAATLEPPRGTPVRLLRIGDRVVPVTVQARHGRGHYTLAIGGYRFEVEALDERSSAIREMTARSAAAAGPAPVVAPMPGLVVRINVAPGDAVAAGQGVIVMEAMKMENELRTPAAGTVRAVRVSPGTAVEKGTVLIELE